MGDEDKEVGFNLKEFQRQHLDWARFNFGDRGYDGWRQAFMGVVEEVGELSHAFLKQTQRIRGSYEDHEKEAKDAVGDIIIYLSDLCSCRGWDLSEIMKTTWDSVRMRNWKTFPNNGVDS